MARKIGFNYQLEKCSFDMSKMAVDLSKYTIPYGTIHVALKADDGYAFNDDGTISVTDQDYDQTDTPVKANQQNTIEFDIDNSQANGNFSIELDMTATVAKVAPVVDPTYKQNLSNCTSNYNAATISKARHTINFKASDGYVFLTGGQVLSGSDVIATIEKTGTDTASVTFTPTDNITVNLSADVKPDPTAIPLILNIKNVVSEYTSTTVNTGKSYSFKLNGTNGSDNLGRTLNNGTIDIKTDDDKHKISVISSHSSEYIDVAFSVPTNAVSVTINYKAYKDVAGYAPVKYKELTNCTVSFNGLDEQTAKQETSNTFTFKANKGFIFSKQGTITSYNQGDAGLPTSVTLTPNNTDTVTTELNTSKAYEIYLDFEATNNGTESTGGYVNIYSPSLNAVNELSNEALWSISGGNVSSIDKNNYIHNFYRLPFHLTGLDTTENVPFLLGVYKSVKSTTTQINQDTVDVNVGSISVPSKYGNSYDYQNTKCTLYLPFVKSMQISIGDVLDSLISVHYIIDLFTGNTTINILNAHGVTITTTTFKLSTDLPLIDEATKSVKLELNNTYENNITQAFLVVNRKKPISNALSYPTLEQGQLKNYHGYIECSDIQLNSLAYSDDLNIIKGLLQKGVFIK